MGWGLMWKMRTWWWWVVVVMCRVPVRQLYSTRALTWPRPPLHSSHPPLHRPYASHPEWVEEGLQMLGLPRLLVLHAHGVCRQGLDALREQTIAVCPPWERNCSMPSGNAWYMHNAKWSKKCTAGKGDAFSQSQAIIPFRKSRDAPESCPVVRG